MPEVDGYETAAAIRAREKLTGKRLPILGLTAHGFAGSGVVPGGGYECYVKPIRQEDLHRVIAELAQLAATAQLTESG